MNTNPPYQEIPPEIVNAAIQVERWYMQNGINSRWQLMGICSRDYAKELPAEERDGKRLKSYSVDFDGERKSYRDLVYE